MSAGKSQGPSQGVKRPVGIKKTLNQPPGNWFQFFSPPPPPPSKLFYSSLCVLFPPLAIFYLFFLPPPQKEKRPMRLSRRLPGDSKTTLFDVVSSKYDRVLKRDGGFLPAFEEPTLATQKAPKN